MKRKDRTHADEVARISRILQQLIEIDGRSQRTLEPLLGLGSSGLSKVLNGVVRLQMDHVLRILDVLEIPPGQFFAEVFPSRGKKHAALLKLREINGAPEEEDSPEFDARVGRALLRILQDQLQQETARTPEAHVEDLRRSSSSGS
jgi:transcriptional regulator with XRE-family HTH domain